MCNLVVWNKLNMRLAYMETFNKIVVIPLPHLNLVNFVGMGNKHDYLIWRESKGYFTALNRKGQLTTWSNFNGKLLYTICQNKKDDRVQSSKDALLDYDVFRADCNDITYTRNFYQLKDRSVNLLKSRIDTATILEDPDAYRRVSLSFRDEEDFQM